MFRNGEIREGMGWGGTHEIGYIGTGLSQAAKHRLITPTLKLH